MLGNDIKLMQNYCWTLILFTLIAKIKYKQKNLLLYSITETIGPDFRRRKFDKEYVTFLLNRIFCE